MRFDSRYTDPSAEFITVAKQALDHPSGLLLADLTVYKNDPYVEYPDVARGNQLSASACRLIVVFLLQGFIEIGS